jgi:hypothetical protein
MNGFSQLIGDVNLAKIEIREMLPKKVFDEKNDLE